MGAFAWFWSGQVAVDVRLAVLAGIVGILLAVSAAAFAMLWRRERRGRHIEAARAETGEAEVSRLSGELDRNRSELAASHRKTEELSEQAASLARDIDGAMRNPSPLAATFLRQYALDLGPPRERLEASIRQMWDSFVATVDSTVTIEHARAGPARSVADFDLDAQRRRIEDLKGEVDKIRGDAEKATRLASDLASNAFDASVWKRRVDRLVGEPERAAFPSVIAAARW